jgi:hypothetical protein
VSTVAARIVEGRQRLREPLPEGIAKYSPRAAEYFAHGAKNPRQSRRNARSWVGAQPALRAAGDTQP